MINGPVEFLAISFAGNDFRGEIIPAMRDLVDQGIVRIVDLVFIRKDEDGHVTLTELEDLDDAVGDDFDPLVDRVTGLVAEEDVNLFATAMADDSSAAVVLLEYLWAIPLRDAIMRANGKLVANGHVPRDAVMDLLETYGEPVS